MEEYLSFVRANLWQDFPKLYYGLACGCEIGELLSEIKSEYRDKVDKRNEVRDEAGDVIFYLTALLDRYYDLTIEDCMKANMNKLTRNRPTNENTKTRAQNR
jgi:NTP pyrophosphatase (non-canonical NTP hydrolase)